MIIFEEIRDWASRKGILDSGDIKTQALKFVEEFGELSLTLCSDGRSIEQKDAIGDMLVVVTNMLALQKVKIENVYDFDNYKYTVVNENNTNTFINLLFIKVTYQLGLIVRDIIRQKPFVKEKYERLIKSIIALSEILEIDPMNEVSVVFNIINKRFGTMVEGNFIKENETE